MSGPGAHALRYVVLAGALLLAGQAASAQGVVAPELETELSRIGAGERVSVIVRFTADQDGVIPKSARAQRDASRRAELVTFLKTRMSTSRRAVQDLVEQPAVSGVVELWGINGLALTASPSIIQTIAARPGVARISLDAVVAEPRSVLDTGATTVEWNLEAIGAPELWAAGHEGSGVVVATMDSGVDPSHQDLAARYRGGDDSWLDPFGEHATPYDRSGHGTQVLGLILGGAAGGSAIGVAPGARWIAARIFDDDGKGTVSAIHQVFQWLLDPDGDPGTDDAPDVVNGSWDLGNVGGCDLEFEEDLEVLEAAGIAVVLSGGNYGPRSGTSVSPANNPSAFAVGAVDENLLVAAFSSSGPSVCGEAQYPELAAPGVRVRTSDKTYGGAFPDAYVTVSGTSAAAPHVAGAMALLLDAFPEATVAELRHALTDSAVDAGPAGPDDAYGHGVVDVVAAARLLALDVEPACADLDGDGIADCLEPDCGRNRPCTRRGPERRVAPTATTSLHGVPSNNRSRSLPW